MTGTVIGQAFIFLITPVLTRLYSQELFGAYFIFVSTINILKKVTTLRFELAIILTKRDSWAINALFLSLFFTIATSLFFFIISIFLKNSSMEWKNLNEIKKYLWLIPLTLFFAGIFETLNYWNNRFKFYKKISATKALNNILNGLFQITFASKFFVNSGLILGNVIGQVVSSICLMFLSGKMIVRNLKFISFRRMKYLLMKYKDIPTFNTLINFVNNISNELPVYLFAFLFSPVISGLYGMANKLTAAPMDILGLSIGNVFFQKASEKYYTNQLKFFFENVHRNLVKLGLMISVGILILVPFVGFILGKDWNNVRIYILILIPSIFANFLIQPISSIPTILNKQTKYLIFQIVFIFIKILGITIGYLLKNPVLSLINFSFSCLIFRIIILKWYKKIIQ